MESAPRLGFFEAQSPGPPIPRSTLQPEPHDASCKTWGQDGFALSFLVGLLHSQQYAGLSRRSTANPVYRPGPPTSHHRRLHVKLDCCRGQSVQLISGAYTSGPFHHRRPQTVSHPVLSTVGASAPQCSPAGARILGPYAQAILRRSQEPAWLRL